MNWLLFGVEDKAFGQKWKNFLVEQVYNLGSLSTFDTTYI